MQTHCKVCRKNVAIEKRRCEQAQFDEDIEVAAIKKRQRSGHQKHYWLPPGRTGAERLHNFLCYRPVDEAAVLDTVKAELAELSAVLAEVVVIYPIALDGEHHD